MQFKVAGAVVGAFALLSSAFPADADDMDRALGSLVRAKGFEYPGAPTTEGIPGAVYLKLRLESGQEVMMPVCWLFEAQEGRIPGKPEGAAWQDVDRTSTSGAKFLLSVSKLVQKITGLEVGAQWNRVRKVDFEWGAIQTYALPLAELSETGVSQGVWTGRRNSACYAQVNRLISRGKNPIVLLAIARAESLKATVELNPSADPTPAPAPQPNALAAAPASPTPAAASAATTAPSRIEAALAAGLPFAQRQAGTPPVAPTPAAGTPAAAASTRPAAPAPCGASGSVKGEVPNALKLEIGGNTCSSGDSTLEFRSPMVIGWRLKSLKALRKEGLFAAQQVTTLNVVDLSDESFEAIEAVSEAEFRDLLGPPN